MCYASHFRSEWSIWHDIGIHIYCVISYDAVWFATLVSFHTHDMLQIHYKWMVEIFCSIFIEQSTMPAVIGVFSSAISTKRNNTVKCNVTYRFSQNNHFPPFPSCILIFLKRFTICWYIQLSNIGISYKKEEWHFWQSASIL